MNRRIQISILAVTFVAILLAILAIYSRIALHEPTGMSNKHRDQFENLRIAFITHPYSVLIAVAHAKGFFEKEGLKVEIHPYAVGKDGIAAILAGKADLTTAADTGFANTILKGSPVRTAAVIATSEKSHSIIARKDRGITKHSDLRGKKIGVTPGTFGDFNLNSFLTLAHIPPQQVHILNIEPKQMVDALRKGEVDAVSTWEPFTTILKKELGSQAVEFDNTPPITTSHNLVVRQDFSETSPLAIQKALRALLNAEAYTIEHPDEAQKISAESIGGNAELLKEIWDHYAYKVILDQNLIVRLEEQARWLIGTGQSVTSPFPNFLNHIYLKGLATVAPDRVTVIHKEMR